MPKEKNESDTESFQTGASGEAGVKPAEARVNFPKWKCEKGTKYGEYNKEGWSGHVMGVKAYCAQPHGLPQYIRRSGGQEGPLGVVKGRVT